tara:strand:- start:184 stop:402 length:219 start_codon:yes stop_codon:yes gene_type:complete
MNKMKLKINGEFESIDELDLTVTKLLGIKNVKMPEMVSVELNGDILDRDVFDTTPLKENDEVEFLYFMGGGL